MKLVTSMLVTGWACVTVSAQGSTLAELKDTSTLSFASLAERSDVVFDDSFLVAKSDPIPELHLEESCEPSLHQLQGRSLTLEEIFSENCKQPMGDAKKVENAFAVLENPLPVTQTWATPTKDFVDMIAASPQASQAVVDEVDASTVLDATVSPNLLGDDLVSISTLEDVMVESDDRELESSIGIHLQNGKIVVRPASLKIQNKAVSLDFVFEGVSPEDVRIFLRNQKTAELGPSSLVIKEFGSNEIYIVWEDQMKIVPVEIAEPADALVDALVLNSDEVLVEESVAEVASLEQDFSIGTSGDSTRSLAMINQGGDAISIAASREQSIQSIQKRQVESSGFNLASDSTKFSGRFAIQVVDDRSSAGSIYPVVGAKVAIAGSDIIAETDATGHFYLSDLPKGSSLALAIEDPNGYLYPTSANVAVPEANQVAQVRAARFDHISLMAQAAGTVQQADQGILCVSLGGTTDFTDYGVGIDAQDQKAYYYNDYGFIDPAQNTFASNGKACFFNLPPNLYHLTVGTDEVEQASIPVQVRDGRFTEVPMNLDSVAKKVFRLAAVGSVTEQLSNSPRLANRLRTVADAELIGYGGIGFESLTDGVLKSEQALFFQGGSAFVFQDDPNFEPTLYRVGPQKSESVLPLLPMGFVEDLASFADLTAEAGFAHLVANFHKDESLRGTVIQYEIYDYKGEKLDVQPFFFGETPTSKAIYFNLEPGIYQLVMKDDLGNWLASDQMVLYSDIVSYFEAGSRYIYTNP